MEASIVDTKAPAGGDGGPTQRPATHVPFLDDLRGVAIIAVFLFHCMRPAFSRDELAWNGWFRDFTHGGIAFIALSPISLGWAGVAVFFVVSGFCVHLSHVRSSAARGDWTAFFVRRFFRIYPPYAVSLLIFALVFPGTHLPLRSGFDWGQFVSHLFLFHNFGDRWYFGVVPAFWSIAVEAQLYAVYPLLLLVARRCGWWRALVVAGCVELSLRALALVFELGLHVEPPRWLNGAPFYYWYSWAIGAALADAWLRGTRLPFTRLSPSLCCLGAIVVSLVRPLAVFSFPAFSLLTVVVIARRLERSRAPATSQRVGHPWLRTIGTLSYSIYLLHQPLIGLITIARLKFGILPLPPLFMYALGLATFPLAWALSALFHRACELPSIALGKQLLRRLAARRGSET